MTAAINAIFEAQNNSYLNFNTQPNVIWLSSTDALALGCPSEINGMKVIVDARLIPGNFYILSENEQ